MSKPSTLRGLVLVAAAVALLSLSALATSSVDAARGGGSGKGGKPTGSTATLSVSPNPAAAWGSPYTLSGTGFAPNASIQIGASLAGGCCSTFVTQADANGAFSLPGTTGEPGPYTFTASVYSGRGWNAVATTTLQVQ